MTETGAADPQTAGSTHPNRGDGTPVIEIDHVTKRFEDYVAVADANFS
ncbi:MAG: polyamine ABC transporter ATP-binding protein, partial [Mycobacteriaceae bacterium]